MGRWIIGLFRTHYAIESSSIGSTFSFSLCTFTKLSPHLFLSKPIQYNIHNPSPKNSSPNHSSSTCRSRIRNFGIIPFPCVRYPSRITQAALVSIVVSKSNQRIAVLCVPIGGRRYIERGVIST